MTDKEGHYISIKESILQEYINIFTVDVPNKRASQNMRLRIMIELPGETDGCMTITGNINTPPSETDRYHRWSNNKDTVELNTTINKMDLIEIFRILHSTTADYTTHSSQNYMENSPR